MSYYDIMLTVANVLAKASTYFNPSFYTNWHEPDVFCGLIPPFLVNYSQGCNGDLRQASKRLPNAIFQVIYEHRLLPLSSTNRDTSCPAVGPCEGSWTIACNRISSSSGLRLASLPSIIFPYRKGTEMQSASSPKMPRENVLHYLWLCRLIISMC